MLHGEFVAATSGRRFSRRTWNAAYRVLVLGMRPSDAAAQCGITPQALSRALTALKPKRRCPLCGHTHRKPTSGAA